MTKIEFLNMIGTEATKELIDFLCDDSNKQALLLFNQLSDIDMTNEICCLFLSYLPENLKKKIVPSRIYHLHKVKRSQYPSEISLIQLIQFGFNYNIIDYDDEYFYVRMDKVSLIDPDNITYVETVYEYDK